MSEIKRIFSSKKKIGILSAIIITIVYVQFTVWADIPEITGPAITYNYLSSEETDPYLVMGKTPEKREDIRAAKKWPDARSCLVRYEKDKETPDLRRINWRKMRTGTDIEVCIFRIFASLGTPENAKAWFKAQGLLEPRIEQYQVSGQQITRVKAYNLPRTTLSNYVPANGLQSFFYILLTHGEGFRVIWNGEGRIMNSLYEKTAL